MNKKLNPAALIALKEALVHIYWYKKQFKSFLLQSLPENIKLNGIDWDLTKREISEIIVESLSKYNQTDTLLKLAQDICQLKSFEHLRHLDDGAKKVREATDAVNQLRLLIQPSQDIMKAEEERQKRRKIAENERLSFQSYQDSLNSLKNEFYSLISEQNSQKRGFILEKLMHDIFLLNDLDPKSSFKIIGQQIDGAFTLGETEFLFEAKWTKELINSSELVIFKEKVKTKLENTLGLFLSIEGFSEEGVIAAQSSDKRIILMDGSDLISVLEGRIPFIDLIMRKKQIASREGKIFVPFSKMTS